MSFNYPTKQDESIDRNWPIEHRTPRSLWRQMKADRKLYQEVQEYFGGFGRAHTDVQMLNLCNNRTGDSALCQVAERVHPIMDGDLS